MNKLKLLIVIITSSCTNAEIGENNIKNEILTVNWQQEAIEFVKTKNNDDYLEALIKAARKNSTETIKFLNYSFLDGWDAAAAETHSENVLFILENYRDSEFNKIVKLGKFNKNQRAILLSFIQTAMHLKKGESQDEINYEISIKYPLTLATLKM